jgi:glycosyltransferase involved in cell wall biosynthesis
MPDTPKLSVVIASIVGPPFIDDCLGSLEDQARELGAEVIVAACGTEEYASRISRTFPWVKVLHSPVRETVPELRRRGVDQATGDIVAIIEEHCLADGKWLYNAVRAHSSGDYAAVGGPVADHGYRRLRDWLVYFVEYNGSLPPAPAGEVTFLNGANIAYRRQALVDYHALLGQGYWEASLHPALLVAEMRFLSAPGMAVYHRGPFNLGYYLKQRYWFSRAFAGARAKEMPPSRRLAYLLAAPLLPGVLLARMALRVWSKRCRVGRFVLTLPLFVPALAALVAGEWVGYAAGPGDALSKVE